MRGITAFAIGVVAVLALMCLVGTLLLYQGRAQSAAQDPDLFTPAATYVVPYYPTPEPYADPTATAETR
jgi:hypothetical protein